MTVRRGGPGLIRGLLVAAVTATCAEPSSGPAVGSLEVRATTTGADPDPDGYQIVLDDGLARPLGVDETILYPSLAAGDHRLVVRGIAANCTLAGDATRPVTVDGGETAGVELVVTCEPTSGRVALRTVSTGDDIDPSGYTVVIDDVPRADVEPTGTTEIIVAAGVHSVALDGANANCDVAENPRGITVVTGATVPATFTVRCLAVPPAGRGAEIAFATDRREADFFEIAQVNSDGTALRTWGIFASGPASWSPDGGSVAVSSVSSILIGQVDLDGNFVLSREIVDGDHDVLGVAWSPDGSRIAYIAEEAGNEGCADLNLVSPDGSDQRSLAAFLFSCYLVSRPGSPTWSPDASRLAVAIAISVSDTLQGLVVVDSSGESSPRQVATPAIDGSSPSWSPDGSRIAFTSRADGAPDADVFVVQADGTNPTRLTDSPGDDTAPTWSPDGSKIAFVSHRDGNAEIYVMNADGSQPVRITNDPASDSLPAWRP